MEGLTVNVAGLLQEATGSSRRVVVDGFYPGWEGVTLVAPLTGSIELVRAGKGIVVRSELSITLELACSRCLGAYAQDLRVRFDEMFYPRIDLATNSPLRLEYDDIDHEFLIENVDRFDLSEAVRQHVEISQPLMPRCRRDCRGICPACGINRNETVCDCAETEAFDPRYAPIQEMLRQTRHDRPA